ncbi:hypothetical protein OB2597_19471 [Pseudooceanicola batsensis HTCC2597]|uniref:FAD dependent oxidoreductase domain-containing protein n=1 Tax=Pseudooceanicola batsensis (strain ATCC BAA-863 / DSM 15984 / KCTC 12145 / HTCC2597) TaxID=252305 RepID=A3U0K4_PSEBH|nr:FAD-binding oxidoreductase [Pseudooceanicola batsensis]EAQ02295.1 hypothetical protein OB2597_19471 [Pseudooceanicola batsensis HTCC2597]
MMSDGTNKAISGNLWQATAGQLSEAHVDGLAGRYDLAVIGAGYTGLSTALHAAQQGASVVVIEAESIGHGGSGRNVGLVNAGLWLPPGDVAARLGEAAAERLSGKLAEGPSLVFNLIETHQIRCEAVRNGTLHCAHSPGAMRELDRRHGQLTRTGAPVVLLDAAEARRRVGSDKVHGALFDPRAGTIQPLAYARGLARAARAAGAVILEGVRVRDAQHDGEAWRLMAGRREILADALIEATNAYGGDRGRFAPLHFFQMATDPLPEAKGRGILPGGEGCWDTALVMSAFRRDRDGRVIVGGIGSLDHGAAAVHRAWARRKLGALFPELAGTPLTHGWSGTIASTADHLPRIRRLGPRGYAAFGYSGRGIGTGTVFGRDLARAALTGCEEDLPLEPVEGQAERFGPARGLWYESGALVAHALGLVTGR